LVNKIDYKDCSEKIVKLLGLKSSPISIHILNKEPKNIKKIDRFSAVCGFWGYAQNDSFYALALNHFDCPIGAEVVGFKLDEGRKRSKDKIYDMMVKFKVISKKALENLKKKMPRIKQGFTKAIIYEPLAFSSKRPDVAILKCNPFQAMLLASAIGKKLRKEVSVLTNFPGCCIIPIAYKKNEVVMSLACDGSRKFMPIYPEELLVRIPGKKITELIKELEEFIKGREEFEKQFE